MQSSEKKIEGIHISTYAVDVILEFCALHNDSDLVYDAPSIWRIQNCKPSSFASRNDREYFVHSSVVSSDFASL